MQIFSHRHFQYTHFLQLHCIHQKWYIIVPVSHRSERLSGRCAMSALPPRTLYKLPAIRRVFDFSINNLITVILELTDPAAVFLQQFNCRMSVICRTVNRIFLSDYVPMKKVRSHSYIYDVIGRSHFSTR